MFHKKKSRDSNISVFLTSRVSKNLLAKISNNDFYIFYICC
nr:MAG TPA: hypothetical protein [Caudoviricetes sp.]